MLVLTRTSRSSIPRTDHSMDERTVSLIRSTNDYYWMMRFLCHRDIFRCQPAGWIRPANVFYPTLGGCESQQVKKQKKLLVKVTGQNGTGQNGTDKMVGTKW